ncbi:hypothetical protein BKN14_01290 [Candidatus Gracilibacteria bacterium HOT-871]|nr:hypothetical protein BKN14_01290 [Candidatus Gracilibacteria bacterium HOT-871]MBB1564495.1 hypothetical protein [Candidatus Gracilibacteria bacterium]RKW22968.1 MAG: hypothetical protein D8B46_04295 [Candidatus Gracilibacteria bacterium]
MKKILFFILVLLFSFSPKIYANDSGFFTDAKSIKDLKKDINNINKIESDLELNYKSFLQEHNIDNYLKKGMLNSEIQDLKSIATNYVVNSSEIEKKISNLTNDEEIKKLQNSLIDLTKELYKNLLPFIDTSNYKSYLVYVENSIKNQTEKNNLYLNKFKTQNIYNKKLDILGKKIQENKEYLDDAVKKIIEQKLDEKIIQIMDSPAFSKLSTENKVKTLEKVIERINLKVDSFQSKLDYDSIYIEADIKKLEIYKVLVQRLKDFSQNLK